MSTFSVLKFSTADGALQIEDTFKDLQRRQIIAVQDAALVVWPQGGRTPKTMRLNSLAGPGALADVFWGMLFGLIFSVPFFGLALGPAIRSIGGKFSNYGIDEMFIKQARVVVTEGTSALFLLTSDALQDKAVAALKGQSFQLIATNVPKEKEIELRAAFGTMWSGG